MILLHLLLLLLLGCGDAAVITITKELFSQSFTDSDVAAWTIGGAGAPTQNLYSVCAGDQLFGGYGLFTGDPTSQPTFITRTIASLPEHWSIRVRAKIYKIDAWAGDNLLVRVDGATVSSYSWSGTFGGGDICGTINPATGTSAYNDGYVLLDHNASHTSSTLSVYFFSDLWVAGSAYWGIRYFQIDIDECLPNCGNCDSPTQCLSCPTVSNLQPPISIGGGYVDCQCLGGFKTQLTSNCLVFPCMDCLTVCATGFYPNGALCSPCASGCTTCTGPTLSSTDCSGCSTIGHYSDNTILSNVCPSCHSTCYTCSGNLATQCTACSGGLLLSAGACVSTCPSTFYGKELLGQCLSCSANCATCFGGLSTQCSSCVTNFYLSSQQCVSTCPSNYYGYLGACVVTCPLTTYGSAGVCQPCAANCDNCTSTMCLLCSSSSGMYTGACVTPCPSGTYLESSNRTCSTCDASCLTCSSSSSSSCTGCLPGLALMPDGTCTTGCLPGTYISGGGTCSSCDPSCATCVAASATACKSCYTNVYFDINNTQCVSACTPSLQAIDNSNMMCWTCPTGLAPNLDQCITCSERCLTCFGSHFDECLTCTADRYLTFGLCICNEGTYYEYGHCVDTNKTPIMKTIIWACMIINLSLCLLLEVLFKHPTNLIQTIEMFQLVSFSYYLSTSYPYELDEAYQSMIKTHVALLISPIYLPKDVVAKSTGKFAQTGIIGHLAFDGQGIIIGYVLLLLLALIPKLVKMVVDPRRNRSIFNACSWLLDKLSILMLLWFRVTVMVLFTSATITFQNFEWANLYDLASLGFFVLVIGLMIVLICVKKWDEDSKTYQFLLVYNNNYDYKYKKEESEHPEHRTIPTESNNETKENIITQEGLPHNEVVGSTVSLSPLHKSTQRKFNFPPTAKAEPDEKLEPVNEEYELSDVADIIERDSQYKPMQVGPLLQPIITIALSVLVPILKFFPNLQAILFTAGVAIVASNSVNQVWRRKITKLNCMIVVVVLMIHSMLLTMLASSGMTVASLGLMILWTLASVTLLTITAMQLLVNFTLIPRIFTSLPVRLYNVLHAEPKTK